ncbi:MAG: chloride channel protein [Sumerlaeia bacterium]
MKSFRPDPRESLVTPPSQKGERRFVRLDDFRGLLRSEAVIMVVLAAVVGIASAYAAVGFKYLIEIVNRVFFQSAHPDAEYLATFPWWWLVLAPAIGGLICAQITRRFSRETAGSGVTEIIEAVALKGGRIPRAVAPVKALASAVTLGSGGSAGREGPIVQISGAIGSYLGDVFRLSARQRKTLIGCGVAGGISATFNTPFAGAFVAVEVILGDFGTVRMSPIVIASVLAAVVGHHYVGDFPHIMVPAFEVNSNLYTIWPYIFIGIACGLASLLFIHCMRGGWWLSNKVATHIPHAPYIMPGIGGLITGLIALAFPQVLGVGYEVVNLILDRDMSDWLLLGIFFAKILATSATVSTGGSGGTFTPSLFLGAVLGKLLGDIAHHLYPGMFSQPYGYALVGMGAMLAATYRAPITAILIVFELTRVDSIILPIMAAVIPSALISQMLHPDSIYSAKLTMKGLSIKPKSVNLLKGIQVEEVMRKRVDVVDPGMSLIDLIQRFVASPFTTLMVADRHGKFLGMVHANHLESATMEKESLMNLIAAIDITETAKQVIHPHDELTVAMKLFSDPSLDILPVLDKEGKLVGDLLRSDVLDAYERELAQRDALATTVDAISVAERRGRVQLSEGYVLVEYEVPPALDGKTLVELQMGRRFQLHVVLLKRGNRSFVPHGDTVVQTDDVMVLSGREEGLEEKLRQIV